MVLSLTYTAVTRCGLASIKKSGISFKGWKERWVILKPNFLLVYKNTQAHDFIFRISLASIKDMCIRDESAGRPRCLQITMRGGTQYLFTFQSETEFDGWYDDIYRLSPLAPVLIIPEGGEFDEEDIIDGYLDDDYSSTLSPSTIGSATRESSANAMDYPLAPALRSTFNLQRSFTAPDMVPTSSNSNSTARSYQRPEYGAENAINARVDTNLASTSLPSTSSPSTSSPSTSSPSIFSPSTSSPLTFSETATPDSPPYSLERFVRSLRDQYDLRISSTPDLLEAVAASQQQPAVNSNRLELTARQRDLVRQAISFLCSCMEPRLLRRSDPGGEKPFDLVEIRLRALLRVKKKWRANQYDPQVDNETVLALSEALKDGYILCQTLNAVALGSSPAIRPNDRDNINLAMFLSHCRDFGIPREELFSPGDLTAMTAESSARVAQTIITLAKLAGADGEDRKSVSESLAKFSKNLEQSNSVLLQRKLQPGQSFAELEESFMKFIASRRRKKSLRYDHDQAQVTLKVYQNVASLLETQAVSSLQGESLRLKDALINLVNFMASLDTISSLVESRQFRIRLLQFSAAFHSSSDYQSLREALKKDEIGIENALRLIVHSDEYKQVVTGLRGEDAQSCVDLIQDVLDRRSLQTHTSDDVFYHHAQRILVKLSEHSDTLPTSLFIGGVNRRDPHPCTGGTFADIYRATYRDQDVALKRIRIFQGDAEGRHKAQKRFCREALMWQRLHHPFVLPFCGIDSESFPSYLCMVSPWMRHGTILRHLNDYAHVNVEQKLFEIAQGLHYLHSQNVVHGDLRGSNILVDEDWHACLADFGLAVFEDATMGTPSQQAGSVRWMAPELHHPQAFKLKDFRRTFASDVYSFACVCVEVFTGKSPFADIPHDSAVMLRVMAGERPERPECTKAMPDWLWDIVQSCWRHSPQERPSMSRVVELMKAGNGDLRVVSIAESSSESLDWDISLHSPSGSKLVRRRKLGSRSARAGKPSGLGHKQTRSS